MLARPIPTPQLLRRDTPLYPPRLGRPARAAPRDPGPGGASTPPDRVSRPSLDASSTACPGGALTPLRPRAVLAVHCTSPTHTTASRQRLLEGESADEARSSRPDHRVVQRAGSGRAGLRPSGF